jgi:hypothetical protein
MQNYENYKLQVHFCIFISLHMLNLFLYLLPTHDQDCKFTHLQVYKFPSLKNIIIYKLQINHYNFTISQITSACLQVYKFPSLQNKKITNYKLIITILQIASACLQVCKFASLQVCKI